MKIGRNDPCPCGSGKKYKHCCLLKESMSTGDLIRAAVQNAGYKEDIANVLCNLSEYMKRNNGGVLAMQAVLPYMLRFLNWGILPSYA